MEKNYLNIISLLKLFNNRPYHLAKYLLENESFNEDFLNKLNKSSKLKNDDKEIPYFNEINKMNDYFSSLIELNNDISFNDIENDLNSKLVKLIKEEKFEEAAIIRDMMDLNGISRKK